MRGAAIGGFLGALFGAVLMIVIGDLIAERNLPPPPRPVSDLSVGELAEQVRSINIAGKYVLAGGILGAIAVAGPGASLAARGRRLRAAAGGFLGALLGVVLGFALVYFSLASLVNPLPKFNSRDQGMIDTMKALEGPGGNGPGHNVSNLKAILEDLDPPSFFGELGSIPAAIGGAALGGYLATWKRRVPPVEVQT
jgi:hypothetical protein